MSEETMTTTDLMASIEVTYDHNHLMLDSALGQAIADLARRSQQHQKVGELTLKIKLKPINTTQMSIIADLKVKPAEPSSAPKLVYTNRKGELCFDDPEQDVLPGVERIRSAE